MADLLKNIYSLIKIVSYQPVLMKLYSAWRMNTSSRQLSRMFNTIKLVFLLLNACTMAHIYACLSLVHFGNRWLLSEQNIQDIL